MSGRNFTRAERTADAGVAIVSQTLARQLWPAGNGVGQHVRLDAPQPASPDGAPLSAEARSAKVELASRTVTVVGIVRNPGRESGGVYVPTSPEATEAALYLRVRGNPEQARQALLERLSRIDPGVGNIMTLRTMTGMQTYLLQIGFWVTVVLGGLALVLTVSGLFSVLSYVVEQQAKEIGVRMALGAATKHVAELVLSQSLRPVGIGLVGGGGLAAAVAIVLMSTPAASEIGSDINVFDPVAYAASLLVILTACVLAVSVPALRAARIDPIATLRKGLRRVTSTELAVQSERVVFPDGMRPASIHVRDGRIVAVRDYSERPAGVRELDAGDLVVLPGLVDTHVHINDPGRADWEGFEHATKAAAAGGVTTLVDMPLNSIPPTTDVEGLEAKRRAAAGRCHVDVGFWGGVVPGNSAALEPLARAGVLGFKCFLSPSGVEEFAHVGEQDLREAVPILAGLGLPLLAHAEWPALLRDPSGDPRQYATWLASRPPASELAAIALLVRLAREHDARVHIVHLASADALTAIREARAAGLALTVETCPHYLTFAAEEIPDGATAYKCAPPIRQRDHRERLWSALSAGTSTSSRPTTLRRRRR